MDEVRTIKDLIAKLMEMGFSPDAEIYIEHYGEYKRLDDFELNKDVMGNLLIKY